MNEQVASQVSAFIDGELSEAESELLVRRLASDQASHDAARRYLLIGHALRGDLAPGPGLADRVARALESEAAPEAVEQADGAPAGDSRWWRPVAGTGVAAAVALAAVFGLQGGGAGDGVTADAEATAASYTVAPVARESGAADVEDMFTRGVMPPPVRLTNYLMSHGEYAGSLGRKSIQSGIVGTSAAWAISGRFELTLPPAAADDAADGEASADDAAPRAE